MYAIRRPQRTVRAMARANDAAYWSQRMRQMEQGLLDQSYAYVENLERQFTAAQAEVERQLGAWYQHFAANNEITLVWAKRLLDAGELAEFRWSVGEYIAYGQQNALDGAWMRQLENASTRAHVSRLEAIQLQLQQQAETLYTRQLGAVDAAAREMYLGSYYGTAFELQRGMGVGWTMGAVNEAAITKVLSRPWTADNLTFRDRCWSNKQALVNSVNTQLTQMIIRGEAPDRAIAAVAHQFDVSKSKAGRLVMTESAYFASAAQKDSFTELGVEQFKVVAAFDKDTCGLCGGMDGKVFQMSEYQVGLTAPPFHPWCRCCTAPYFEDMTGERWARDVVTGETFKLPGDATFEDWKALQDAKWGDGTVDLRHKMSYNESADKAQLKRYQELLGRSGGLKSLGAFQDLKYSDPAGYSALKTAYADKRIQRYIQSTPELTTLARGKQGKHILGHNNYTPGRGYLTITMDEAQALIWEYAGTGAIKRDGSGRWTHKEFVTIDRVIGYYVSNSDGTAKPTRRFRIDYATGKKKGTHIIPVEEM